LTWLRDHGFVADVVERWIPHANLRRDLFGCGDLLGVHARDRLFLLVQVTTAGNVAARLKKARGRPELAAWLRAGGRFEVHGWQQRGGRWQLRRVEVQGEDLVAIMLFTPRPRRARRGERQGLLPGFEAKDG
jgi:hypothetical protein